MPPRSGRVRSASGLPVTDMHSHIVMPEVLALLERDGAAYDTRIVERNGRRVFVIEETAARPINAQVLGLDDGAARLADMHAEGIEREAGRAQGVAGLLDEPRSGAPRRISDEQVEAVVVKTLESTPRDATHWSVRSMAASTGMSRTAIFRIWQAFGLQPHRTDTFKLSTDPQLIEKVRDIVGLILTRRTCAGLVCG